MNNSRNVYGDWTAAPGHFNANYSTGRRMSIPPCVGVPVYTRTTIPGSRWRIKAAAMLRTQSLDSPVFGNLSFRLSYYWLSWSAVIPKLRNPVYAIDSANIRIPRMFIPYSNDVLGELGHTDITTSSAKVNPGIGKEYAIQRCVHSGSIINYFGIPTGFVPLGTEDQIPAGTSKYLVPHLILPPPTGQTTEAIPYFMYYAIFYHHKANLQAPYFYFLGRRDGASLSTIEVLQYSIAELQRYIDVATSALSSSSNYGPLSMMGDSSNEDTKDQAGRFCPLFDMKDYNGRMLLCRNGGLWCSPAKPDYNNKYVSRANAARVSKMGKVKITEEMSGSSSYFTIDQLIIARALRKYNALGAYRQGTFSDWLYAQYEVHPRDSIMAPVFLCRDTMRINFNTLLANSAEGLGELGGTGSGLDHFGQHRFSFDNYGTIMAIAEIIPDLTYFQGRFDEDLRFLSDIPAAALDTNDLVPTPLSEMVGTFYGAVSDGQNTETLFMPVLSTGFGSSQNPYLTTQGYRPRFMRWKTDVDRTFGDIAGSLSYWTFNRPYGYNPFDPQDVLSTKRDDNGTLRLPSNFDYVLPGFVNRVFSDTSNASQNFILELAFDITCRLPLYRPNFANL